MTCEEVSAGLLERDDPLPVELRRHLKECRRCRRLRRRLQRLHEAVRRQPAPAMASAARATLLERLGPPEPATPAPAPPGPAPALPAARSPWGWALRGAAALLIGAGFWWSLTPGPPEPEGERPHANAPLRDRDVLARLLERHLRLAEGLPPGERLRVLAGMAADLRSESLRLADAGKEKDLPAVAALYRQVIREGVMPRARGLAAGERRVVLRPLLDELRQAADEAERTARDRPAELARPLQRLAATAREARGQLVSLLEGKAL
jgi:hypothetical protein